MHLRNLKNTVLSITEIPNRQTTDVTKLLQAYVKKYINNQLLVFVINSFSDSSNHIITISMSTVI